MISFNTIDLQTIAKNLWHETRLYNYKFQIKVPELKTFVWPKWNDLLVEFKKERIEWVRYLIGRYLIENDFPDFKPWEKHEQSIIIRLENGWQLSNVRNDKLKLDPHLRSWFLQETWFQNWGIERDDLFKKRLKEIIMSKKRIIIV